MPVYDYHHFTGLRKLFLDGQCAMYFAMRQRSKNAQARICVEAVSVVFLEAFPWWLPESVEPRDPKIYVEPTGPDVPRQRAEATLRVQGWIQAHLEYAWGHRVLAHAVRTFEDQFGMAFCQVDHACACGDPRAPVTYVPEALQDVHKHD